MTYTPTTYTLTIEAYEWNGDNELYETLVHWSNGNVRRDTRNVLIVQSHNHTVQAYLNDYITKDHKGTLHVLSPDLFGQEYGNT